MLKKLIKDLVGILKNKKHYNIYWKRRRI